MKLRPVPLTMLAVALTVVGGSPIAGAGAGSEPGDDLTPLESSATESSTTESSTTESSTTESAPLQGADLDAAIVCHELANAMPDRFVDVEDLPGLDDPVLWRLQAVTGLGKAAALGDPAFGALGDAADMAVAAWSRIEIDLLNEALATMRDECAGFVGDLTNGDDADESLVETPSYEADATCALAASIPDPFTIADDLPSLDEPLFWRFQGITSLGHAAALGDREFEEMGDAADDLQEAMRVFDQEQFDGAVGTFRDVCAR